MSVHLEEMLAACKPYTQQGQLPSYIPALKKGTPNTWESAFFPATASSSRPGTAACSSPFKAL